MSPKTPTTDDPQYTEALRARRESSIDDSESTSESSSTPCPDPECHTDFGPVFKEMVRRGAENARLRGALELSSHRQHGTPDGQPCLCGQCDFVRTRDAALSKESIRSQDAALGKNTFPEEPDAFCAKCGDALKDGECPNEAAHAEPQPAGSFGLTEAEKKAITARTRSMRVNALDKPAEPAVAEATCAYVVSGKPCGATLAQHVHSLHLFQPAEPAKCSQRPGSIEHTWPCPVHDNPALFNPPPKPEAAPLEGPRQMRGGDVPGVIADLRAQLAAVREENFRWQDEHTCLKLDYQKVEAQLAAAQKRVKELERWQEIGVDYGNVVIPQAEYQTLQAATQRAEQAAMAYRDLRANTDAQVSLLQDERDASRAAREQAERELAKWVSESTEAGIRLMKEREEMSRSLAWDSLQKQRVDFVVERAAREKAELERDAARSLLNAAEQRAENLAAKYDTERADHAETKAQLEAERKAKDLACIAASDFRNERDALAKRLEEAEGLLRTVQAWARSNGHHTSAVDAFLAQDKAGG